MIDWKIEKIEDVIVFNPSESINKGVVAKKIPMGNLTEFQRKINGFELTRYSSGPKFRNGDTLLAKITPCVENGKTAFVDILDENEVAFGSSEFIVLRKTVHTDSEYIYYLAISPTFRARAISCMEGTSGRQRVNEKTLRNFELPFPPLNDQRTIAKVLSDLDSKIELNNKINAELEAMARLIYDYWFVQFDFPDANGKPYKSSGGKMVYNEQLKREIPEGWEVKELGKFGKMVTGKTPSSQNPHHFGDKVPFFTPVDFNNDLKIQSIADRFLSHKGEVAMKNYLLPKGSIMVTCIGSDMGKVSLTGSDALTNQQINSIIPLDEEYQEFLYQSVYLILPYLKKLGKSGSTVPIVNKSTLDSIKILDPRSSLVKDFSHKVNPLSEQIHNNIKQNQKLSELRDWLLPMLMNGQVTVGEAEDYVNEEELSMAAEETEGYGTK